MGYRSSTTMSENPHHSRTGEEIESIEENSSFLHLVFFTKWKDRNRVEMAHFIGCFIGGFTGVVLGLSLSLWGLDNLWALWSLFF
ncbi:MAG: hypothetical protein OXH31_02910 [Gammaproteobacteria bacterium]|nr:hypothetical protein [Gammaproteobacteria bacterium]